MRPNTSYVFNVAVPLPLFLKYKQHGSSLVIALFIMVVMSVLGAALINVIINNEEDYAYEVIGTRALHAAQTGAQWRLQQIFPLRNAPNVDVNISLAACVNGTLNLANINGLNQCTATVQCATVANNGINYMTVTSVGQCNINGESASRVIEVQAKSIQ